MTEQAMLVNTTNPRGIHITMPLPSTVPSYPKMVWVGNSCFLAVFKVEYDGP